MSKIIYSFAIIIFGLLLGYGVRLLVEHDVIQLPFPMDRIRKWLQRGALLFVNPVAVAGAIWTVNVEGFRLAALPLIGLFSILAGGIFALALAGLLHLGPKKTGAMFCCGSFANIGSIGALICFVFLGEEGFALVPIYRLFEELCYYSVGFPIAKYYSGSESNLRVSDRIRALSRDPFILAALSGILLGALLNLADIQRPSLFRSVVSVFVPLGTVMLLVSIGMALKLRRVRDYVKECISVSLIKFVLVPGSSGLLGSLVGFGTMDGGLPLKVVLILSSMPVAFVALIPPSIYDLDLDLANSCWLFTTSLLAVILPLLLLVISII